MVKVKNPLYFIYILECTNAAFYTGYTTDLKRRYQEHCNGSAKCKYTRSFPPRGIAMCWQVDLALSTVLSIESAIKRLSKSKKEMLIQYPDKLTQILDIEKYENNIEECLEAYCRRGLL